jgi:hypothetical protein
MVYLFYYPLYWPRFARRSIYPEFTSKIDSRKHHHMSAVLTILRG